MASRRVSITLDEFSVELVRGAAARAGMSLSAWLAETARQEAVRQGAGSSWGDHESDALADDADHVIATSSTPAN
ncbi:hypothetical protein ACR9E3_01525 [Actinomycetospora sp. C-140]